MFSSFPSCPDKELSDEEGSGGEDSEGSDEDGSAASEEEEEEEDTLAGRRKGRSHSANTAGFHVQSISDFESFTEGMDDLGSSEEEEHEDEESGMEEGEEEEDLEHESEEDAAGDRNSEDDGVVMTFSGGKVSEEVEKGRAVKNQIGLSVVLLLVYLFIF